MAEDQGSEGGAEATDATPGTDAEVSEADAARAAGPPPETTATSEDEGDGEAEDKAEPKVEGESESDDSADAAEGGAEVDGGLDLKVERGRLDEVSKQIEEGRQTLADLDEEVEPGSDEPPVAEDEGAANAPPG